MMIMPTVRRCREPTVASGIGLDTPSGLISFAEEDDKTDPGGRDSEMINRSASQHAVWTADWNTNRREPAHDATLRWGQFRHQQPARGARAR